MGPGQRMRGAAYMKGSMTAAAILAVGLLGVAPHGAEAGGVRIVTGSGLTVTKQFTSWKEADGSPPVTSGP